MPSFVNAQVWWVAFVALAGCSVSVRHAPTVVLISANAEWRALAPSLAGLPVTATPWGESVATSVGGEPVVVVHGGWGKIAAAGSAQWAIDLWHPALLVNLGTCGGFEGKTRPHEVVLAERTVVYDIIERMGDPREAVDAYATTIDLGWVGAAPPTMVTRGTLVSADQDLDPARLSALTAEYGAIAGDWESGAIAHVARRNGTRLLVLRGVSDVVGEAGSVAYGNEQAFAESAARIMSDLWAALPAWIERSRAAPR
jgi:adenosylhomocysteine nucleosidase